MPELCNGPVQVDGNCAWCKRARAPGETAPSCLYEHRPRHKVMPEFAELPVLHIRVTCSDCRNIYVINNISHHLAVEQIQRGDEVRATCTECGAGLDIRKTALILSGRGVVG